MVRGCIQFVRECFVRCLFHHILPVFPCIHRVGQIKQRTARPCRIVLTVILQQKVHCFSGIHTVESDIHPCRIPETVRDRERGFDRRNCDRGGRPPYPGESFDGILIFCQPILFHRLFHLHPFGIKPCKNGMGFRRVKNGEIIAVCGHGDLADSIGKFRNGLVFFQIVQRLTQFFRLLIFQFGGVVHRRKIKLFRQKFGVQTDILRNLTQIAEPFPVILRRFPAGRHGIEDRSPVFPDGRTGGTPNVFLLIIGQSCEIGFCLKFEGLISVTVRKQNPDEFAEKILSGLFIFEGKRIGECRRIQPEPLYPVTFIGLNMTSAIAPVVSAEELVIPDVPERNGGCEVCICQEDGIFPVFFLHIFFESGIIRGLFPQPFQCDDKGTPCFGSPLAVGTGLQYFFGLRAEFLPFSIVR